MLPSYFKVAALNQSLVRTVVTTADDVVEMDDFTAVEGDDSAKIQVRKSCFVML